MDVTHPARWLHLGSAPVHPVVLEYHQGMWHIHFGVHSLHSVSRRPVLDQSKQTVEDNLFPRHGSGRTSLSLTVVKKSDKYLSTHIKTHVATHVSTSGAPFINSGLPLLSMLATCCYLFIYFLLPLFFLQTLHIYCSHTSHIVSASYSSSGSPGLNHGECLSSDIYGCFFQLAWIHVCRENMNGGGWMAMEGPIIALLVFERGK